MTADEAEWQHTLEDTSTCNAAKAAAHSNTYCLLLFCGVTDAALHVTTHTRGARTPACSSAHAASTAVVAGCNLAAAVPQTLQYLCPPPDWEQQLALQNVT
jgi:hypothetical protein